MTDKTEQIKQWSIEAKGAKNKSKLANLRAADEALNKLQLLLSDYQALILDTQLNGDIEVLSLQEIRKIRKVVEQAVILLVKDFKISLL